MIEKIDKRKRDESLYQIIYDDLMENKSIRWICANRHVGTNWVIDMKKSYGIASINICENEITLLLDKINKLKKLKIKSLNEFTSFLEGIQNQLRQILAQISDREDPR